MAERSDRADIPWRISYQTYGGNLHHENNKENRPNKQTSIPIRHQSAKGHGWIASSRFYTASSQGVVCRGRIDGGGQRDL